MTGLHRCFLDDWVFTQYKEMYMAFLKDKSSIPPGAFYELGSSN